MSDSDSVIRRFVHDLATTKRRAHQALLVDRIAKLFEYLDVDDELAATARAAAHTALGVSLPSPRAPQHEKGETWVLLHDPGNDRVERLRLGDPGADRFVAERSIVYRGLCAGLAQRGQSLGKGALMAPFTISNVDLARLEGTSWGLAYAVALASRANDASPDATVACSARVLEDGRLGSVQHLGEKLVTLTRLRGAVRRVVIAQEQIVHGDVPTGLEIIRAADVPQALDHFALGRMPEASIEEFEKRILGYRSENTKDRPAEAWLSLAAEALAAACACQDEHPDRAIEGRTWAALFSLHGGERPAAERLVKDLTSDHPELLVFARIVQATTAIDHGAIEEAVAHATSAVELARAADAYVQKSHLGQALGTLGRAHMHAGRYAQADGVLREAIAYFELNAPLEAFRTANYLATCLRLANRLGAALELVDSSIRQLSSRTRPSDLADSTLRFLTLERSRILLAMGRAREAIRLLDELLGPYSTGDEGYPRAGALQTLAIAVMEAGVDDRIAGVLGRCLHVTEMQKPTAELGRVTAIAAGHALEKGAGLLTSRCEEAWSRAFPGEESSEQRRRRLATWIY